MEAQSGTNGKELPNDLPGIILMIVSGVSTVVIGVALLKKYIGARRTQITPPQPTAQQPVVNGAAQPAPAGY